MPKWKLMQPTSTTCLNTTEVDAYCFHLPYPLMSQNIKINMRKD